MKSQLPSPHPPATPPAELPSDAPRPPRPIFDYETPSGDEASWIPLIVLCAVLLALGAAIYVFAMPKFHGRVGQSRITAARTDVANFETALDAFYIDTRRYPSQSEGLNALVASPAMMTNWHGPYVRSIPPDPWNRPYVYVIPGVHNKTGFDLSSDGPDGRPGTADDITNWHE